MRRILILVLCCAAPASATTKIFMKQPFNSVSGLTADFYANTTQSVLAVTTAVTNSATSGTNIPMTKTAAGAAVVWISPPVATGFTTATTAGGFTANGWGLESAATCNCGLGVTVTDITTSCSIINTARGVELGIVNAVQNWTGTQSACVVGALDRIKIVWSVRNVGTMASGQTVTFNYGGPTGGASGDTWIQMPDTISFQTEGEFIQTVTTVNATNTLPGVTAAGNAIGVLVVWSDQTSTVTIADGADTFTPIGNSGNPTNIPGGADRAQVFLASNASSGGPRTVAATWSGSTPAAVIIMTSEYGGVTTTPLDVNSIGTGTGTAMSSGSATTTAANDILVGFGLNDTAVALTVGASNVKRNTDANSDIAEDQSVTSKSSYSSTATGTSGNWFMQMLALKWGTQPITCAHTLMLMGAGCS